GAGLPVRGRVQRGDLVPALALRRRRLRRRGLGLRCQRQVVPGRQVVTVPGRLPVKVAHGGVPGNGTHVAARLLVPLQPTRVHPLGRATLRSGRPRQLVLVLVLVVVVVPAPSLAPRPLPVPPGRGEVAVVVPVAL